MEVEPLLEEEGAEEGKEGGAEEVPPGSPSVSGGRTSILPDVCDKKVAFEIAIEREGGREEGEEDEDEDEDEEGGRKGWHKEGWAVWRTYEDFDDLHAALLARFFPEEGREGGREGGGEGGCPLKRPNYIGLREGRAKEQGKVLLRVVDVVSDMRSLSQYLSQVLALRLQCQELRDFLVEEEEEDEEGREEGVVLKEEREGKGGKEAEKRDEEGEEGGREEGKEGLALRQVYLGMRRSLPAEEHHVRLRTFKVGREGGREGGTEMQNVLVGGLVVR